MTWRHAQARHARLTARWHHAHHGRSRHRSSTRRHTWHARLSTRTLGHVHRPEHELLRRHARAGARNHLLLLSILTAPVRSWLRHALSSLRRRRRHDALPSLLYSRDASSRTIAVPIRKKRLLRQSPSPSLPRPPIRSTTRARLHAPRSLARVPRARSPPRPSSDPSSLAVRQRDLPSHDFPPFARVTAAHPSHGRAPSTHDRLSRRPGVALARRVVARTRRRRDRSVSDDPPPFVSVARFRTASVDLAVRPRGEGAGKSDERVRGRPRDRRTRRRSEDARSRGRAVVLTLGFAPCVRSSVSTGIPYSIFF